MTYREPGTAERDEAASRLAGLAALLRDAGFSFQDSDIAAIEADRQSVRQRVDAMCAEFAGEERFQS